jgi:2-polyprenyl-3-methyl-5-hydroxy-6-metoxy-1,4-benzoquinol methylase
MSKFGLRRLNPVSIKYRDMMSEDIEQGRLLVEPVHQCACCSGTELEKLLEVDRFDLPFGSYICEACGLIITSPRIKQESLKYYYDKYYHPLNYGKEDLTNQGSLYGSEQGVKVFSKLKPYISKSKIEVLEIGAGVGNVLKDIQDQASALGIKANILGTEYSHQCIETCGEIGIEAIFGDAQTVVELGRTFDLIILSHVFEHFIDLKVELARLSKLLTKDGLIYIEVPGIYKNHMNHYYDFSFLGYSVHAHMYNFTLKTLESILAANGFSMVEGDETVYGIFRFTGDALATVNSDYFKIMHYLEFLQENQEYALSQHELIIEQKNSLASAVVEVAALESEVNVMKSEALLSKDELAHLNGRPNLLMTEKATLIDEIARQDVITADLIDAIKNLENKLELIICARKGLKTAGSRIHMVKQYAAIQELLRVIDVSKT